MSKQYPLGRLMMRAEGEFWNAYFGTGPEDAIHLGSMRMSIATESRHAKEAFMAIFSHHVAAHIKKLTGQTPTMNVEDAPEHERSGRG